MSSILLKAAGLHTHNNKLGSVPPGAMLRADNVIIDRDGVVEPRRGFFQYAPFGSATSRSKQLLMYKGRILQHFDDLLQFDNGAGVLTSFSGNYTEPEVGRRIQGIEANGNFFFTTNTGIKKISASSSADLSSTLPILNAGGVKAINLKAVPDYSTSGFLTTMSKVAYRLCWGIKDLNNNLILGTPSERVIVTNESNTQACVTQLLFLVPSEAATTDYFYQIYRTDVAQALGLNPTLDDLAIVDPGDEQKLVYEAALSLSDISRGFISIQEVTPESFAGANLYTNPVSGDGILQSNDKPPLAKALALYKNHTFYANTKTRHILDWSLLGIGNFTSGVSNFLVSDGNTTTTIKFVGAGEKFRLGCDKRSNSTDAAGFLFSASENERLYHVWYKKTITTETPTLGSRVGVSVDISAIADNGVATATAVKDSLEAATTDFIIEQKEITITAHSATGVPTPNNVTINSASHGLLAGEWVTISNSDEAALNGTYQVQASNLTTNTFEITVPAIPAIVGDVSETATGLTSVLLITAFAGTASPDAGLSTPVPGGANSISTISQGIGVAAQEIVSMAPLSTNPVILTTPSAHMLSTGDRIKIYNSTSTPSIDGEATITVLSSNTFSIPTSVTISGTAFFYPLQQALLADFLSPAQAVDATARSLCDAINKIPSCPVNAFYASGPNDVPGLMYFEAKSLGTSQFYLATSDGTIASDSDPELPIIIDITSITPNTISPTVTTSSPHNLTVGQKVIFLLSSSATSINGIHVITEVPSPSSFKISLSNQTALASSKTVDSSTITADNLIADVLPCNNHSFVTGTKVQFSTAGTLPGGISAAPTNYYIIRVDENFFKLASSQSDAYAGNAISIGPGAGSGIHTVTPQNIVARLFKTTTASSNEEFANRLYYSKYQQPEAVPTVNYLDVGPKDQAIKAIVPLRDSLFIFKEDGTYRLSGENSTNFSVNLYDSSTIINAADSVAVLDNQVYVSTTQGIVTVSDTGGQVISSPIEEDIIRLGSKSFTSFKTASFGVAYPSANSYLFWTVEKPSDTVATQAYRYNTGTNSWVKLTKGAIAAVLNPGDDKLYLSPNDLNAIEKERKDYARTDYADREYTIELLPNAVVGNSLSIDNALDAVSGDVIAQEQFLTIPQFNRVLKGLDLDTVSTPNYFSSLEAVFGDNLRTKLLALAQKLDADVNVAQNDFEFQIASYTPSISFISASNNNVCTIVTTGAHNLITNRIIAISNSNSTPSIDGNYQITVTGASTFTIQATVTTQGSAGDILTQDKDFKDLQTCFNNIVYKLNNDYALANTWYPSSTGSTVYELVVSQVDRHRGKLFFDYMLPFLEGPLKLYKHINSTIVYTPYHFGDAALLKQVSEGTFLFDTTSFTRASVGYSSDLSPNFELVTFYGTGSGTWGNLVWGDEAWGGDGTQIPLRTLVPLEKQRCRYLQCQFSHAVAREQYALLGISLEGRPMSSRGYK